jgi:AcrR family transcriptional regulator
MTMVTKARVTKKSSKPAAAAAGQKPLRARILEAAFSAFMERGFAETSTLEIATRARLSKRELYAEFGSKQDMLVACIRDRAKRMEMPADMPKPRDREALRQTLLGFGARLLRETSDPAVVAVFRLAIAEAQRAPEVGRALNEIAIEANRAALREIMRGARAGGLVDGEVAEMSDHFAGLLWGNRMLGHLLGVAERPDAHEVTRRAELASDAFLRAYPVND